MDIDAYLGRIGADRGTSLHDLHRAHQERVPFENLSIHLGETISLAPDDLFDKIVRRGRGGFCYELNGAFAILLEGLGHRVDRIGVRVFGGERFGPIFDHLGLIVDDEWLVDVGFGAHSTYPLSLGERGDQKDPGGVFVVADGGDGDLLVSRDGQPVHRIERRARDLIDFGPACWWQQTWPGSHFRKGTVCTRLDGDGRITISGRTLIRTGQAGRTETVLESDAELLAAYRDLFGVVLERAVS
ncbi:arylamine N-acetyltransferase family protein [Paractinoplanes toevensis]|uniref:N-hydroxyarylamine O-acetyltransferase n=1 Tax=Paractinoplanes toevensis TaxID=571911 RepID=A0A919TGY5_9ACTN|nr:arylamine N-acetyltransferase [Actinoplanes toevensis]GIM93914.1 N-hydroxyarylamine O-acetyltransferase [Actinoplanes toevensis]